MEKTERKLFYIFLAIHVFVWSLVPMLRNVMSIDAMEAVSWGELISFGTNKHPPLSGWLAASVFDVFGHHDFTIYLLGQIFILIGFIYIYKLAQCFLNKEQAFCSAMIMEGCYYYTWMPFIDNFNPNILLIALWPAIIYYFYKSIQSNNLKYWVLLGITAGFGVLGKYQCVFLFASMLCYLLFSKIGREQFKRKGLYIAGVIGLLTITPHVIWLYNNDFFSFIYMMGRTHSETHNLPLILLKLKSVFYPIKFILGQLMAGAGCVAIFLITALKAKNIKFDKGSFNDGFFIICTGLLPILLQGFMGVVTGSRVPSIWGSTMLGMWGIILFYFFPVKFNNNTFGYFVKWVYTAMFGTLVAVLIFMVLQTKLFISYPHQIIMKDFDKIWAEKTNNAPLKYVGGYIDYIFQFRIYNSQHPVVILETFGHKNPWINHNDTIKSGAIIFANDEEELAERTKELLPLLPENYKIIPEVYNYEICNKVNKCKSMEFFYTVVPPLD